MELNIQFDIKAENFLKKSGKCRIVLRLTTYSLYLQIGNVNRQSFLTGINNPQLYTISLR